MLSCIVIAARSRSSPETVTTPISGSSNVTATEGAGEQEKHEADKEQINFTKAKPETKGTQADKLNDILDWQIAVQMIRELMAERDGLVDEFKADRERQRAACLAESQEQLQARKERRAILVKMTEELKQERAVITAVRAESKNLPPTTTACEEAQHNLQSKSPELPTSCFRYAGPKLIYSTVKEFKADEAARQAAIEARITRLDQHRAAREKQRNNSTNFSGCVVS